MEFHWIEKAMRKTEIDSNGCWVCSYAVSHKGYSRIFTNNKNVRVHRLSYEHFRGEIPEGMMVCHRCDVRNCWNPSHLFLGTAQDNVDDMTAKGRNSNGAGCPEQKTRNALLTEEKVREIRRRASGGEKSTALSRTFGVSPQQICKIIRGASWSWV